MDAWRHAGDDGDVVGVCHGGHGAFGGRVETFIYPAGQGGEGFAGEAAGEVFGVEAVDADYDCWLGRDVVGSAVEGDAGVGCG